MKAEFGQLGIIVLVVPPHFRSAAHSGNVYVVIVPYLMVHKEIERHFQRSFAYHSFRAQHSSTRLATTVFDITKERNKMKFSAIITFALASVTSVQAQTWERLDKTNAVLVIVDIQEGLRLMVKDFDPVVYRNAIYAHAEFANMFNLPLLITTANEAGKLSSCPCAKKQKLTRLLLQVPMDHPSQNF